MVFFMLAGSLGAEVVRWTKSGKQARRMEEKSTCGAVFSTESAPLKYIKFRFILFM